MNVTVDITDSHWPTLEVNGVTVGVELAALDEAVWLALHAEGAPVDPQASYSSGPLALTGAIDADSVSVIATASLDRGDYVFRLVGNISFDVASGAYSGTFSEIVYQYDDGTVIELGDAGGVSGIHGSLTWSGDVQRIDTNTGTTIAGTFGLTQQGVITAAVVFNGTSATSLTLTAGATSNDTINGGAGDDSLAGAAGNDTLTGLGGNDTLDGGTGKDVLKGGLGDDRYVVDLTRVGNTNLLEDTVTEAAGAGTDTIVMRLDVGGIAAPIPLNYVLAANFENFDFSGMVTNASATGNALDNVITGNIGNNSLSGGAGNDTLIGGAGNDVYLVDKAMELAHVTELAAGGTDTLRIGYANASRTIPVGIALEDGLSEFENLTIVGGGLFDLTGNAAGNVLTGNGSANRIDGGAGADTMVGLAGNDVYVVDDLGDKITDASGIDTVESGISWTIELSPTLENITLTGDDAVNATGNALANVLTGNSEVNVLTGLKGNDTYIVQNAGDVTVEALASGTDVVKTTVTYALGDNVENLILQPGAGDIGGTGNALANTITGNTGNNTLDGGGARDVLAGGAGNDTYVVDLIRSGAASVVQDAITEAANAGNDTLVLRTADGYVLGSAFTALLPGNVENLDLSLTDALNINATGNAVANILIGNDGNNLINGMAGSDSIDAGGGNDILVWDAADGQVDGGAGIDTLRVDGRNLSLNLTDNEAISGIEVISITGTGNNTLTVDANAVLALSDNGVLRIDGNAGDVVQRGTGWVQGEDQVIGANTFRVFTQGEATLMVDTDIATPTPPPTPVADSIPLSGNDLIDGLVQGGSWQFPDSHVITYSLNFQDDGTAIAWPPALVALVEKAFGAWESVADIHFERINSGRLQSESAADIAISLSREGGVMAGFIGGAGVFPDPDIAELLLADNGESRATYPRPEGDIFLVNFTVPGLDLSAGAPPFAILLHEIGHALGLKHPNDSGGNDRPTFGDLGIGGLDVPQHTVMSNADSLDGVSPVGPLALDILALQHIYGANVNFHSADDVYTIGAGGIHRQYPFAIWDSGGTDTITIENIFATIDLREGAFSGSSSAPRVQIAYGAVIENAIGGSSQDHLIGNEVSNVLTGNAGDDTLEGNGGGDSLSGGEGFDDLFGGSGNDTLKGGDSRDSMDGGAGDDTYDFSGDNTLDFLSDSGGVDTAISPLSFSLIFTFNTFFENVVLIGTAFSAMGNDADNKITGNAVDNSMEGAVGADTIDGADGNDTITGGTGNDSLTGGNGDDFFYNSWGSVTILGGAGNDTIIGAGGVHDYAGGNGNDTFVLDTPVVLIAHISDFEQGADVIGLGSGYAALFEGSVFQAGFPVGGTLKSGVLGNAASASTAAERLLYDASNGQLYYDFDGSGGGAASLIATLPTGLTLTASDFLQYPY